MSFNFTDRPVRVKKNLTKMKLLRTDRQIDFANKSFKHYSTVANFFS